MAVTRCVDHPPEDDRWECAIEPVGHPDSAIVCSVRGEGHLAPGLVYLSEWEYWLYQAGKRVFTGTSPGFRIRVSENVVFEDGDPISLEE